MTMGPYYIGNKPPSSIDINNSRKLLQIQQLSRQLKRTVPGTLSLGLIFRKITRDSITVKICFDGR